MSAMNARRRFHTKLKTESGDAGGGCNIGAAMFDCHLINSRSNSQGTNRSMINNKTELNTNKKKTTETMFFQL